jgi:hypothetical protein
MESDDWKPPSKQSQNASRLSRVQGAWRLGSNPFRQVVYAIHQTRILTLREDVAFRGQVRS